MNEAEPAVEPCRRWLPTITGWLCWLYLLGTLGIWGLFSWEGDSWWPVTFAMYGPRWVWGLPLLVLILAALLWRRRMLWVLLAGGFLLAGPVMGLCVPWRLLFAGPPGDSNVRVLSLNVDRKALQPHALAALIRETDPDIVALQDWTSAHEQSLFGNGDFFTRRDDQFFLASRFPIVATERVDNPSACAGAIVRHELQMRTGKLTFFNLRLKTPREALVAVRHRGANAARELEENSALRRVQSEAASRWIRSFSGPVLVAGDFNMPPDSVIYQEYWSEFADAFSHAGLGWGYTYSNNRTWLRLDHILAGPGWQCRRCWLGPPVGSEHRPLLADWELISE